MKILIVGHGFVGQAVDYGFSHPQVQKTIVDPKYDRTIDDINPMDYNLIFICVPTPMGDSGNIDASIVNDVITKVGKCPLIVVKSTVTPDIVKHWPDNVVYNPEFLTERSAKDDFVNPPFHIMGGVYTYDLEEYYHKYSICTPCPVYHMSAMEASYVKYAINTFLSTKVTFFNQLFDSVTKAGGNFNIVANAVGADPRVGYSHTRVPGFDGKQGFGGACFPKDCSAFVNYDNMLTLLDKVININNDYRSQYELDEREKAQNVYYG